MFAARTLATRTVMIMLAAGALGGCARTATIDVDDPADAKNPLCASVILALPESLGEGLPKARTLRQGTAAWGTINHAVTLRCGVPVPGPTTARCENVDSGGVSIDWIVEEDPDGVWRFTTYGRNPATQIRVYPEVTKDHSTSFIADLGPAMAKVPQTRSCVSLDDLSEDPADAPAPAE